MSGVGVLLPLGVLILAVSFFALLRWSRLSPRQAAVLLALLALAAYLPVALVRWPGMDVFAIHLAVLVLVPHALALIRGAGSGEGERGEPRRFHWAPTAILVFFLVVVLVDSVFVTLSMGGLPKAIQGPVLPAPANAAGASTVFPGVVPGHYFNREGSYNAYLQERSRQRKRGWSVRPGWLRERPLAGYPEPLQVAVRTRAGAPVTDAVVQGRFVRPSDSRLDRSIALHEAGPGLYRAEVTLPRPGRWALHLEVRRGEALHRERRFTRLYEPVEPQGGVAAVD